MGRMIDPVCKLCRREGMKLYLKASRCDSPKCPIDRRQGVLPGMHGYKRVKLSEFGIRLREKQKLKRFYGLFERQFRRYFSIASRSAQNTGEQLLTLMERRLDNVIHRLGFAPNRASARQMVSHGHVKVNGHYCNIPSVLLKAGDNIEVKPHKRSLELAKLGLGANPAPLPDFLEITGSADAPSGRIRRLPSRGDVDPRIIQIREQLIIELSTR